MRGVHKDWLAGSGACAARARALCDVSLRLRFGELLGIAGPAGAGKTTLLLCAAGLLRADRGSVRRNVRWTRYLAPDPRPAARLAEVALFPSAGSRAASPHHAQGVAEDDPGDVGLILVDELPESGLGALGEQLRRRAAAGDAVLVASRDACAVACLGVRPLLLAGGALRPARRSPDDQRRNRDAARSSGSSLDSRAAARMRSTCGRRLRSPQ